MREESFFDADDENQRELQTLGGVYRHELDGIHITLLVLITRLERRLSQKALKRRLTAFIGGPEGRHAVGQALVGDVACRSRHHFTHVRNAVLAVLLGVVVGLKTRAHDDELDGVLKAEGIRFLAHVHDELAEGRELRGHLVVRRKECAEERESACGGFLRQRLDRARTDPAKREVDDALKARVVARVVHQAQIGEHVLDFGTLEEALSAVDAVGNPSGSKGTFERARLRVRTIEDRMVAPGAASGAVRLDFAGDPLCFSAVVVKLCHADAVAAAARCPEILAETVRIVCNERVGRVKNRPRRAIVLLKPDGLLNAEVAEEVAHVSHVRTSEGVDRLVVVTHGEDGVHRCAAGASSEPRQHLKPTVLQDVRVLELVDENVTEAVLIMRADDFIAVEKLVAAQKKLGKVHDSFALALLLIGLIDLDGGLVAALLACGVRRTHAVFLVPVDDVRHLTGIVALGIDVERLHDALDHGELIARVKNLEGLREPRVLGVGAQNAVAQAVEGSDPHAAQIVGQDSLQSDEHLLGGLVREGHSQNVSRLGLVLAQEPGDARRQHARLARTRARQNEYALFGGRDGLQLAGIEGLKKIGRHAGKPPAKNSEAGRKGRTG